MEIIIYLSQLTITTDRLQKSLVFPSSPKTPLKYAYYVVKSSGKAFLVFMRIYASRFFTHAAKNNNDSYKARGLCHKKSTEIYGIAHCLHIFSGSGPNFAGKSFFFWKLTMTLLNKYL